MRNARSTSAANLATGEKRASFLNTIARTSLPRLDCRISAQRLNGWRKRKIRRFPNPCHVKTEIEPFWPLHSLSAWERDCPVRVAVKIALNVSTG